MKMNPEMIGMIELDMDIRTFTTTGFYLFKKPEERLDMLNRDMEVCYFPKSFFASDPSTLGGQDHLR